MTEKGAIREHWYTVILLYPSKLQDEHVQFYSAVLRAKHTSDAIAAARLEACNAQPAWNRKKAKPNAWPVLAVLHGKTELGYIGTIRTRDIQGPEYHL